MTSHIVTKDSLQGMLDHSNPERVTQIKRKALA